MEYIKEKRAKAKTLPNRNFISKWALVFSIALILAGSFILGKIYLPLMKEEIKYFFSSGKENIVLTDEIIKEDFINKKDINVITPIDLEFSLIVPKIAANSRIISDVNPSDSAEYQQALTKGVAHAKGTVYPGEDGNVFIFAHSGIDFAEAMRYNAVFYLLNKMDKGDEMMVFYKGEKFEYVVEEKNIVGAEEIRYMEGDENRKTLTLMTCWPPGTTFKRLVVVGQQK